MYNTIFLILIILTQLTYNILIIGIKTLLLLLLGNKNHKL